MKKIILLLLLNLALFANIGTVMAFKGSAVLKNKTGEKKEVATGMKLSQGDTIFT